MCVLLQEEEVGEEEAEELSLREEASALIRLVMLVLGASHTALPMARAFCRRVVVATQLMAKLNKVTNASCTTVCSTRKVSAARRCEGKT